MRSNVSDLVYCLFFLIAVSALEAALPGVGQLVGQQVPFNLISFRNLFNNRHKMQIFDQGQPIHCIYF